MLEDARVIWEKEMEQCCAVSFLYTSKVGWHYQGFTQTVRETEFKVTQLKDGASQYSCIFAKVMPMAKK